MIDYDAIVIGGGPAGATAGYFLARAGWRVAIVERSEFPRRKVCGEFISATSWPILEAAGVHDIQGGPPVRRVGLFLGQAVVSAPMPRGGAGNGWGRALRRETLDARLLDAARESGAQVWQPWRAVSLRADETRQVCVIQARAGARELRAPVIIAAHGSWERGPLATQLARSQSPSDLLAFKARFLGAGLEPDLMPLLAFPGGYGGMVQGDGGRVGLSCCIRRDLLEAVRAGDPAASAGAAVLRHICATTRGVAEALEGAQLSESWLAAGPIRPGVRARYADGVFRVGNIAGESHPIVAEGISMAVQSGGMLADLLCAAPDRSLGRRRLDEVGRAYATAWRRQFAGRLRAAAVFACLAMQPRLAGTFSSAVERAPGLLTLGALLSGKTKPIGYVALGATDGRVAGAP
jgi:flavin-dependent dehydrogenase